LEKKRTLKKKKKKREKGDFSMAANSSGSCGKDTRTFALVHCWMTSRACGDIVAATWCRGCGRRTTTKKEKKKTVTSHSNSPPSLRSFGHTSQILLAAPPFHLSTPSFLLFWWRHLDIPEPSVEMKGTEKK